MRVQKARGDYASHKLMESPYSTHSPISETTFIMGNKVLNYSDHCYYEIFVLNVVRWIFD